MIILRCLSVGTKPWPSVNGSLPKSAGGVRLAQRTSTGCPPTTSGVARWGSARRRIRRHRRWLRTGNAPDFPGARTFHHQRERAITTAKKTTRSRSPGLRRSRIQRHLRPDGSSGEFQSRPLWSLRSQRQRLGVDPGFLRSRKTGTLCDARRGLGHRRCGGSLFFGSLRCVSHVWF